MNPTCMLTGHDNYVLCLLFTPDGRTLISAGMDKKIKLWSVPDWAELATWQGHDNSVNSLALTRDGRTLVSGSSDKTVKLWHMADGQVRHTLQDRKQVVAAVDAGEGLVAAASYGGRLAVWTRQGESVLSVRPSQKNLSAVAFAPGGRHIAVSGLGDVIWIVACPEGEVVEELPGHEVAVSSLRFFQEGKALLSLGYEQVIKRWDTQSWQPLQTYRVRDKGLRGLALSPDEQVLALSLESKVQLWSLRDWQLQHELPVSTKVVTGMAFSPDGRYFAAGAADRKIRVWEIGR